MLLSGCQSKSREVTLTEKTCPRCGAEIEIASIDAEAACDKCGFVIYNDALSCVQWCQYARSCVGEKRYAQLMEVAARQRERAAQGKTEKSKMEEV